MTRVPVIAAAILLTLGLPAFAGTCPDADLDGVCDADDVCPTRPDLADAVVSGLGLSVSVDACATPDLYPGGPCLHSNVADASFTWTAPFAGTFQFDPVGNHNMDVLVAREDTCGVTQLACDGGFNPVVKTSARLAAGEEVRVVVSMSQCESVSLEILSCTDVDGDGVVDPGGACGTCEGDPAAGDLDADNLCDDIDPCIDVDVDGICDDVDLCQGDNLGGDVDQDGVCDFALIIPGGLNAGSSVDFEAVNAPPGADLALLASSGVGGSPCVRPTQCGGLADPVRFLGLGAADGAGFYRWTVPVPASLSGRLLAFQVAWYDLAVPESAFTVPLVELAQ